MASLLSELCLLQTSGAFSFRTSRGSVYTDGSQVSCQLGGTGGKGEQKLLASHVHQRGVHLQRMQEGLWVESWGFLVHCVCGMDGVHCLYMVCGVEFSQQHFLWGRRGLGPFVVNTLTRSVWVEFWALSSCSGPGTCF